MKPLRLKIRARTTLQMRMVPLIDVVFLLLIFFLLTANFRSKEGFLPADLPRQTVSSEIVELEPLLVYLHSRPDGACEVDIGSSISFIIPPEHQGGNFTALGSKLQDIINDQGRRLDDPVKLIPNGQTKWEHVVKAYDALWQINLSNIIFATVE